MSKAIRFKRGQIIIQLGMVYFVLSIMLLTAGVYSPLQSGLISQLTCSAICLLGIAMMNTHYHNGYFSIYGAQHSAICQFYFEKKHSTINLNDQVAEINSSYMSHNFADFTLTQRP